MWLKCIHSLKPVIMQKTENLWHYFSDELDHDRADSRSLKIKSRLRNNTGNNGIAILKVAKPSKYLSNSWRTFEMLLINYEITLDLTFSASTVICIADRRTFAIVDTKLLWCSWIFIYWRSCKVTWITKARF